MTKTCQVMFRAECWLIVRRMGGATDREILGELGPLPAWKQVFVLDGNDGWDKIAGPDLGPEPLDLSREGQQEFGWEGWESFAGEDLHPSSGRVKE